MRSRGFIILVFLVPSMNGVTSLDLTRNRRDDACQIDQNQRIDCYPESGSSHQGCLDRGCCWLEPPGGIHNIPWCFKPSGGATGQITRAPINVDPKCATTPEDRRVDCYPEPGSTKGGCESRGCCWQASSTPGVPYCYYVEDKDIGYKVDSISADKSSAAISIIKAGHWANPVNNLKLDIYRETPKRLHFKITDPNNKRFEVPITTPVPSNDAGDTTEYDIQIVEEQFGIVVKRKSSGAILFDTSIGPLTYADQYIDIATSLPTSYIYGLGEHRGQFWLDPKQHRKLGMWARDIPPSDNVNLYGSHPFFLAMENDGNAYGVFLLNSNAMEVTLSPTTPVTLRYKTIGGILDFYIFTGPSPNEVIEQYLEVIGKPMLPPYWSLGFHNCRWGYGGSASMREVIKRLRDNGIPFDTQWNDIDYMTEHRDWSYDTNTYGELPAIVKDLHDHDQKYVMILDPGISSTATNYASYDEGVQDDIFIKDADGNNLVGSVWPGETTYPDFTNPKAEVWWERQGKRFHDQIPYDGIWIDMNEPSNFVVGSTKGCTNNRYDNPPFTPVMAGGNLRDKTICPSSKQYLGMHYDLHNMYGHFEGIATNELLTNIRKKRPFVLSRSTFVSSGKYVAHWEGDNNSDWYDLKISIPEILNFNMFGIPFVGCDLCGFFGTTTDELCTRWFQLGTFYPFMRNHRDNKGPHQDPMSPDFTSTTQASIKKTLLLRYRILPYLYTSLYLSHTTGQGVARPLFFKYPTDQTTLTIDDQFMWRDGLLVSPVVTQGGQQVEAYFPNDRWFDFYDGGEIASTGKKVTLQAPIDKINLHIRGGTIIPVQEPDVTTTASRKKNFGLIVAPTSTQTAEGTLFWDDGDSLDSISGGHYNIIDFKLSGSKLIGTPTKSGYQTTMTLGSVDVYGIPANPARVMVNGAEMAHTYNAQTKALHIERLHSDLLQPLIITWS
ncbi:hypothetical protein SNE40_007635 [Patella caerulea]|uniref:P-type domain-containing protein n=1 Tax=Patella caerulea TaxID=87958 RepID=A0AAN8K085_PATCE